MAGHTVGFGKTIELDQRVLPAIMAQQPVWLARVQWQKITIGLVKNEPDAPLATQGENLVQQIGWINCPARVIRRDDGQCPCFWADGGINICHQWAHAVCRMTIDIADVDAEHAKRRFMVEITGARHQDFLATACNRQR